MAANMKAVKLRIKSVESTMQITKAMELVASSKLRKAKERADTCRPYFQELYRTLQDIAKGNTEFYSIYAKEAKNEKCCYVLVAGDRGLAGGYNANLFRCFEADAKGKEICVVPVGKKAVEYAKSRKLEILTDSFAEIAVECVTNAVRHGYATRVQFHFFQNDCWRMTVTDNGLPPSGPVREGGGIGGMRRRIDRLGGTLELHTVPRFRIEISVPKEAVQECSKF